MFKASISLFMVVSFVSAVGWAKTQAVDFDQSKVLWTGKKVTGQHNGHLKLKSGQVEVDGKTIKSGLFEIDMDSIVVEDLKDAGYNKKLSDHLRSDDFFAVAKFPTSTLKINSLKPLKAKGATHEVAGDLTIRGITHPITFPVAIEFKDGKATAKGSVSVDRTKYNVRYGSGKFFKGLGDKMIDDNFNIEFLVQTK